MHGLTGWSRGLGVISFPIEDVDHKKNISEENFLLDALEHVHRWKR